MEKLSYLGGLFTGEGHFGLTVRRTRSGLQVNPVCVISMADEETISLAAQFFDELGIAYYRGLKDAKRYGSKKQQYAIQVNGHKRVQRLCDLLIPYLTGDKRHSAELVSEFIASRLDRPRGQGIKAPYTENEIDLVNRLRAHHGRVDLIKNHL